MARTGPDRRRDRRTAPPRGRAATPLLRLARTRRRSRRDSRSTGPERKRKKNAASTQCGSAAKRATTSSAIHHLGESDSSRHILNRKAAFDGPGNASMRTSSAETMTSAADAEMRRGSSSTGRTQRSVRRSAEEDQGQPSKCPSARVTGFRPYSVHQFRIDRIGGTTPAHTTSSAYAGTSCQFVTARERP